MYSSVLLYYLTGIIPQNHIVVFRLESDAVRSSVFQIKYLRAKQEAEERQKEENERKEWKEQKNK